MSPTPNGLCLVTDLSGAEIADIFDTQYHPIGTHKLNIEYASGKTFDVNFKSLTCRRLLDSKEAVSGSFAQPRRNQSREETLELIKAEVSLVMTWFDMKDRVLSGAYHHREFWPVLHWDWSEKLVVVNSVIGRWNSLESEEIRRVLLDRGVSFEARQISE